MYTLDHNEIETHECVRLSWD